MAQACHTGKCHQLCAAIVSRYVSAYVCITSVCVQYCVYLCVHIYNLTRTDWGPALGGDGVVHYNSLPDVNYAFGTAESKKSGERQCCVMLNADRLDGLSWLDDVQHLGVCLRLC